MLPRPPSDGDSLDWVPSAKAQNELLATLGQWTKAGGFARLVTFPLIEPNETFFPDPWKGGPRSLARLLRRLLHYAGIDELDLQLSLHREQAGASSPSSGGLPQDGGVWLDNIDANSVHFFADEAALRRPSDFVVAAAARAVTHAAALHWKVVDGNNVPTQVIDIGSVYLGFGLLIANKTFRGRKPQKSGPPPLGGIGSQAYAFVLATSLALRHCKADASSEKKLPKSLSFPKILEPNLQAFLKASWEQVQSYLPSIQSDLQIPARETWPPAPAIDVLTQSLDDESESEEDEEDAPPPERGVMGMNEGKLVFLVQRKMSWRLAKIMGLFVLVPGGIASRMQLELPFTMMHVAALAAASASLGLLIGSMFQDRRCSESKCAQKLQLDQKECPRCKGTIAGIIGHPKERLAAEEAYLREQEREQEKSE